MEKDSKFTRDENGYIAIRTVSAPYSSGTDDKDSMFTRDEDGYVAVRTIGGSGGGGGDQHNLGYYATPAALREAHPTAEAGDWAIVGSTDTVWIWDTDNSEWVDSDTKGQVTSVNGQTGDVVLDLLPSQTGQSGKFLTTDGTDASWSDKPLVNTATNANSLSVLGIATTQQYNLFVGKSSGGNNSQCSTYIGHLSSSVGGSSFYNTCIGYSARTNSGVGGCVQLGWGTNTESGSFCVGLSNNVGGNHNNYKLLSLDGKIPTARLTKVNSTITLTAAGWSSNTQTVNVTGMTATGVVLVSPDSTDQADYTSAGILCTSQATNSLTFTATTTPTADIDVNVVML